MVQAVRWYLSAFHAGRKTEVAKKPYNPILGETFLCYWDLPNQPKAENRVSLSLIQGHNCLEINPSHTNVMIIQTKLNRNLKKPKKLLENFSVISVDSKIESKIFQNYVFLCLK
jgi:hypothetical protein